MAGLLSMKLVDVTVSVPPSLTSKAPVDAFRNVLSVMLSEEDSPLTITSDPSHEQTDSCVVPSGLATTTCGAFALCNVDVNVAPPSKVHVLRVD